DTETITLAPFDDDKIAHFVAAWYTASAALGNIDPAAAQERTNDLQTAVNDVGLRDMASNPMLLTVMAIVHNHRGTLPRETARLYHECVDLLMLRWRPHDVRDLKDELGVQDNDLYSALWKLAYDAHENQAEREGTADISEAEVVFALRDKLGGLDNAARFCNYVEERAGLLYGRGMDAKGARIFTFPHRTFQEYLAGCHIASSSRAFNRVVGEKARQGEKWRQVLLLATGQTVFINNDAERPIDAVQHLLRAEPTDEEGWRAVWLAGDMLLLIGLQRVEADEVGQDVLPLARTRLAALVSKSHLDPIERAAAGRMLAQLGDPRPGVGLRADGIPDIDWVEIPAGEFLMGSDSERDSDARNNETPQRSVYLPTYMISRYPITYAQFTAFVESDGYTNRDYWTEAGWEHKGKRTTPYLWNDPQWHIANHPVVGVTWYEAYAFTKWLNELVQQGRSVGAGLQTRPYEVRLPTEAEWEKAARGPDGLIYPYGDKFDATKGSARETGIRRTSAVGIFPDGASPYGVLDMSGNVWEWGLTKWRSSYDEPEENDSAGTARRVLRGGS
ncbi:MAG: SUMF1/EgtB/PvdO family nonheme iron enzyme, partial [Anaerolineae bacterium]|nr:SUMF1/EgtB/PvdO family nonheme iron enzyme [Anaerolineae bacterium]